MPLVVFVGVYAFFSIFANNFFTVPSILALLIQTSTFAILSVGAALVLIVGGIDFSLGAVIMLSGSAVVIFATMGIPIWLSMIMAICLGGIVGLLNGFLVVKMRLPSFLTTFAVAMLIHGFLGYARSLAPAGHSPVPDSLGNLAYAPLFRIFRYDATGARSMVFPGISWIVIIMVLVTVFFHLLLAKTRIGRYLYLVGSNTEASRFSGIKVNRVRILAYVLASMLAGLSGILLASRLVGPPGGAKGYEIIGIACAMIGGASLSGGAGSIGGTVIGSLILSTLAMGLSMMNTSNPALPTLFNGFIILFVVSVDQIRNRN
ncbi:MAG: ABC transporter permease [Anaerolineae bacterium]|nr:ABC transporter permease [Anaerolineae bacterium]